MAASDEEVCCRYCLDDDGGREGLISPCLCKGTQAYIHVSCQKKGYEVNASSTCPVCKSVFRNIVEEPVEDIQGWGENSVKNLMYCLPAFNTCVCMYSFVGFAHSVDIRWIPYEAQFALFQVAWQVAIMTLFYSYMMCFKVRNRRKYIFLTFFETPYSYTNLHFYVWLYIIFGISMSKSTFYQIVGLMSQCFTHVHVFHHVDVLQRINRERAVMFIS